jgi:hypothetical protein
VLGANGVRRRVEFALAVSASLHRIWISQIPAADLVTSTAPVHAHIFVGAKLTITGRLRQSPLAQSIASVEFRHMTRVRGRLPAGAALQTSAGPAVLASRASPARPLDADVAVDTIDVLHASFHSSIESYTRLDRASARWYAHSEQLLKIGIEGSGLRICKTGIELWNGFGFRSVQCKGKQASVFILEDQLVVLDLALSGLKNSLPMIVDITILDLCSSIRTHRAYNQPGTDPALIPNSRPDATETEVRVRSRSLIH